MNILIVDDDTGLLTQLQTTLKRKHYGVDIAENGEQALDKVFDTPYDLILLDIMLPRMDGLSVLQEIRKAGMDMPILMLTARSDVQDRVKGLDYGADDYLAKPYEPRELVLKINAYLRRNVLSKKRIGDFEIDEAKMEISLEGYVLDLTKIEFDILLLFLSHQGKVFSREVIFNAINGIGYNSKDRTIDMHISNLRAKIGDDPKNPKYIKSVWGIGYKMVG